MPGGADYPPAARPSPWCTRPKCSFRAPGRCSRWHPPIPRGSTQHVMGRLRQTPRWHSGLIHLGCLAPGMPHQSESGPPTSSRRSWTPSLLTYSWNVTPSINAKAPFSAAARSPLGKNATRGGSSLAAVATDTPRLRLRSPIPSGETCVAGASAGRLYMERVLAARIATLQRPAATFGAQAEVRLALCGATRCRRRR